MCVSPPHLGMQLWKIQRKQLVHRHLRHEVRCMVTCDKLDQNTFVTGLVSTLAVKNNLIPKKQQIRGCGNLLLATTLALGCGVIDRYCRLSLNASAT